MQSRDRTSLASANTERGRRDAGLPSWQPRPLVTVSAEAGREAQGGQAVNFTVFRAAFRGKS